MAGMSVVYDLPLFAFTLAFFYAMGNSKAKVKTALYTFLTLAAIFVAGCLLNLWLPQHPWVIATVFSLGLVAGMAVALTHSRQTLAPSDRIA